MELPIVAIELLARRESLGLSQAELGHYLRVPQNRISDWEGGRRRVPPGIEAELSLLTAWVNELASVMVDDFEDARELGSPPDALMTFRTDEAFWKAHGEHEGTPAVLHRVATARATAMISAEFGERLAIWCAEDIDGTKPPA